MLLYLQVFDEWAVAEFQQSLQICAWIQALAS